MSFLYYSSHLCQVGQTWTVPGHSGTAEQNRGGESRSQQSPARRELRARKTGQQVGDLRHQREHGGGEEYPNGTGLM